MNVTRCSQPQSGLRNRNVEIGKLGGGRGAIVRLLTSSLRGLLWILQPRIEVEASASDIPALEAGAGPSSIEAGLRLRYEIRPEFAPYVGVEWSRAFGDTADYLEAAGGEAGTTRFVIGLKAWF